MHDDRRQLALLGWYDRAGRRLPWRHSGDPYAVLVSEFMLQQTQVARVVDRFSEFLQRFPDVAALAAAGAGAVIDEWHGLGYNRRAVALHRTAERIVTQHDGRVPRDPAVLETLPGVGPYTARAIAAFAYAEPVAPVDVNIARVLSRGFAGHALQRAAVQAAADAQVEAPRPAATRPGDWSQALMDLGAVHCRPRRPVCSACPILTTCAWRRAGAPPADDTSATNDTSDTTGDPAAALAARGRRQGRFAGSDRQHRGMLLAAVRKGPVPLESVPQAMGLATDRDRADRLARDLAAEGLLRYDGGQIELP